MGISFKVSKVGSRFRPKHFLSDNNVEKDDVNNSISEEISRVVGVNESSFTVTAGKTEGYAVPLGDNVAGNSGSGGSSISSGGENEVSFTLNLFQDGYCIKKPSEVDATFHSSTEDGLFLHPYDRNSESLFSAIESGRLPRDMFDDISCKYVDGGITCEVRDYRKSVFKPGCTSVGVHPVVKKVVLKMSFENIVKDIPSISDTSWTYGDLMEVESRIVKALQPKLYLEPTPMLDLLCADPKPEKLNLGIEGRRKRFRCITDVTVTSSNMINGKKVCIDKVFRSRNGEENVPVMGESGVLPIRAKQSGENASVSIQPHQSKVHYNVENSGPEPVGKERSYSGNMNSTSSLICGKMGIPDGDFSPPSSFSKRVRPISTGPDICSPRNKYTDPQSDVFNGSEWKHAVLQQQIGRGFQQANPCVQNFSSCQMFDSRPSLEHGAAFSGGQQGMKELIDVDKLDLPEMKVRKNNFNVMDSDVSRLDLQQERFLLQRSNQRQQQQQHQHAFMSSGFSQIPWNFPSQQHSEKDIKKDEQFPKRKPIQSPHVSSGAPVQSPLSSKSGDFSSGSLGPNFGGVATASTLLSHKEKKTSSVSVSGTPLTSSANDSLQRQNAQLACKRRSNSLPRTPSVGGVGSPASVGNISLPMNVSSPPCGGIPHSADQNMLERFSKIESMTKRYQLNRKKNKVASGHPRNSTTFCGVQIAQCLSALNNSDDGKYDADIKSLEKSVVGGSVNVSKMRVLSLMQADRILQGNVVSMKIQSRMIMVEKPSDGTVAIHCGDAEIGDVLAIEDSLPTLPNAHMADLLADQFHSLMMREGHIIEDHIQPKPTHMNLSFYSQANDFDPFTRPSASDSPHYTGHPSNMQPSGNASLSQPHFIPPGMRTLSSGNHPPFHMGQALMSDASMATTRTQLLDQQPSQQILKNQHSMVQQQNSQLPRSPLMLMNNTHSPMTTMGQNSTFPIGGQVMNKPSNFQFQMLQQQQQQPQMQRKLMMGAGMGNNLIGARGMGPVISMNGATGATAAAVGGNTLNLNQGSITQQLRSGQLTQAQAALIVSRMRIAQSQGIVPGNCQANLQTMAGIRQMNPGSSGVPVLGSSINRGNMNYMSRASLGNMGPPKFMAGTNMYMSQQQQQLQLQQFQQQLQQQQLQMQQHQLLQNETTSSSLHSVVSPSQVGSPSPMVVSQQQHPSPHQRTPVSPQMSGGGILPGNPEGLPSSPQLSSQTLGSVGSITNSSLELPGVNMTNSAANMNA